MITIKETKAAIEADKKNWRIYLMDFVDDFRRKKDRKAIMEPFALSDERIDAMLAATTAYLCNELKISPPEWIHTIPSLKSPWFVSGLENLKAAAVVESPLQFRLRKIFVLENFLSRV